jgi:hypothetical protein
MDPHVPVGRTPEGTINGKLTAETLDRDRKCGSEAKIKFGVIYNTYNESTRSCNARAESEMSWVTNRKGDPDKGRSGWIFNHNREHSNFPDGCTEPKISYRKGDGAVGPAGCSELKWTWDCPYPCENGGGSSVSSAERCYSEGTLGIAAWAREAGGTFLPEVLYVHWVVQGDEYTCNCNCGALIEFAQTHSADEAPYFGPHYDFEREEPRRDPSDCPEE